MICIIVHLSNHLISRWDSRTEQQKKKAFGINFAHSILVLLPGRKRRYITTKLLLWLLNGCQRFKKIFKTRKNEINPWIFILKIGEEGFTAFLILFNFSSLMYSFLSVSVFEWKEVSYRVTDRKGRVVYISSCIQNIDFDRDNKYVCKSFYTTLRNYFFLFSSL